jgi:hypothetical protein
MHGWIPRQPAGLTLRLVSLRSPSSICTPLHCLPLTSVTTPTFHSTLFLGLFALLLPAFHASAFCSTLQHDPTDFKTMTLPRHVNCGTTRRNALGMQ